MEITKSESQNSIGKTTKEVVMNTLNGLSIGIIVALDPSALLNQLLTALLPVFPGGETIMGMTMLSILPSPL